MSKAKQQKKHNDAFVDYLMRLDRGRLAQLRNASSPDRYYLVDYFMHSFLPKSDNWRKDAHMIVANLFARAYVLYKRNSKNVKMKGGFGASIRKLRFENFSSQGVTTRFIRFLSARTRSGVHQHLGTLVKMAASRNIPIDWADLLTGLCNWFAFDGWVQIKFSSNFWADPVNKKNASV